MLRHTAAFMSAFALGLYLVPVMIRAAKKLHMVDVPDGKIKQHRMPVPYLGGLAIYVSFVFVLALIFPLGARLLWFVLGTTILLFVGLVDDFNALSPLQKICGQIVAAACFLKGGFALKSRFFTNYITTFASGFWMLSVINAFNLVDVMDGLATVLAILATGSFLLIAIIIKQYLLSLFLITLLGALFAFLVFNKPDARVYLGDAGSLFIGGFLAATPLLIRWTEILSAHRALPAFARGNFFFETGISALIPILIVGVPLLEVVSLIVIRKWNGLPFYFGGPQHFSSYLRKKGWSEWQVLFFAGAAALTLSSLALLFMFGKLSFMALSWGLGAFLFGWLLVVFW